MELWVVGMRIKDAADRVFLVQAVSEVAAVTAAIHLAQRDYPSGDREWLRNAEAMKAVGKAWELR